MLFNYVKIALRNLFRQKLYSFLNIAGLAIGIACCMLILLYIQDELSYDRFHENAGSIYRLNAWMKLSGQEFEAASTTHATADIFKAEFPEILNYVRFSNYGSRRVVRYNDKTFNEERFIWADSTLFQVFSFELMAGNPHTALVKPNTVVITEDIANKYFGVEDPVGKNIIVNNTTEYTVTGIVRNFPGNSHIRPDFIGSFCTLGLQRESTIVEDMLNNFNYFTYFLLREGTDAKELDVKIAAFINKVLKPVIDSMGGELRLYLENLTDIHFHTNLIENIAETSDISYVYLFAGIGLFILLIACLNFMNLVTARSANRAKEVGLRKVVGAQRIQLVQQFLGESVILAFISILLAIIIAALLMSFFNDISGKNLSFDIFANPWLTGGLIVLFIVVGILGGSYPAFFLSAFRPVEVIRGTLRRGVKSGVLRIVLVSLQFTVSIVLIIGTLIINEQLQYMRTKRLGYDKDQVLAFVMRSSETRQKYETIKTELLRHPGILAVSASDGLPNAVESTTMLHGKGNPEDDWTIFGILPIDNDFIDLYNIEIVQGRNFSEEFPTDREGAILVNEAAAAILGWQDNPLGREIEIINELESMEREARTIIGVVEDFHFESLHEEIRPLVIYNSGPWDNAYDRISVKIDTDNVPEIITFLKNKWAEFDSKYPFEFSFIEERYDALYRSEENLVKLFGYFTALAIIIGCLGLFGLASFTAEQRTKEIGVRKVLGASVTNIILLLVREFTRWVVVAVVIAWPVSYFLMNDWLRNFAYRVNIGVYTFAVAAAMAFMIAVLTVSYQAVRAALSNPVNALKYE